MSALVKRPRGPGTFTVPSLETDVLLDQQGTVGEQEEEEGQVIKTGAQREGTQVGSD